MRRIVFCAATAALAFGSVPARAAGTPIVAGPGAFLATYSTPVVVAKGGPVLFVNADIQAHDVVSEDTRAPGTVEWCPTGGPRCPLFYADLIGVARTTQVHGLDDIPSGTYAFRCTPHSWMEGVLVVP